MTNQTTRAALALFALLGFAVGLPWINLLTGGHPDDLVPRSWPDLASPNLLQDAWQVLRWSFLDGSLWLWLAHTALWLVWLIGLVWIVTDVVNFVRQGAVVVQRRSRPRTWFSRLVAAVLVLVLAGAANAQAAQRPSTVAAAVDDRPEPELLSSPALQPVTTEVRPGESLSSIAGRMLGDRDRWPELWEHNRGVVQSDGRALNNPNLIRPKWKLTAYVSAPPASAPPSTPPEPPVATPPAARPNEHPEPDHAEKREEPAESGVDLTTGAYVSLGLAAAIAATYASVRLSRRRRYRVGSGDRSDLQEQVAPAVRELHTAADAADDHASTDSVPLGVRESREFALDSAAAKGLGLVGDGALPAARALLLHALTSKNVRIVATEGDFKDLLDGDDVSICLDSLVLVSSLDAAIDEVEATAMTQLVDDVVLAQLLVAAPSRNAEPRLRMVVENVPNLTAIMLGTWTFGTTVRVESDGTVGSWQGDGTGTLEGSRLYNVPADDLRDLLTLLEQAERTTTDPPSEVQQPPAVSVAEGVQEGLRSGKPLSLRVFGRFELNWGHGDLSRDIADVLAAKQREVLVYLALKPEGVRREELNKAIWPDSPSSRPYNSLHTAMSLIRKSVANTTDDAVRQLVLQEDGLYRLDPEVVGVDCWQLNNALKGPTAGHDDELASAHRILAIYRAELAENLRPSWLEIPREALRRDVLDALNRLAKQSADPEQALAILEQMLKLDLYNESIYQNIMRAQVKMGQREAARRTLELLRKALRELGLPPAAETLQIMEPID
nr:BTAD domain-containing putative transcriptional regulator [Kibdelosporangium sp. MJ126-NF4]CEL17642.1 transcriptional regulator, SARP family [Kibdelosporangium sp. MJ126-NF4]CTQ91131.1 transcriptional regulator, SARP family [Kibdelosporangium sp. MJ126-NF4]